MTKILAVGDFHGQISKKLFNRIKKEKPDVILTPGDFCGNQEFVKLEFKYYGSEEEQAIGICTVVGRRNFKEY